MLVAAQPASVVGGQRGSFRRRRPNGVDQSTHGGQQAIGGEDLAVTRGDQIVARQEQLVVRIQKIEQAALADVELLGIHIAGPLVEIGRASCRERVCQYV